MLRLKKWIALMLAVGLLAVLAAGCAEEPTPVVPTMPVAGEVAQDDRTWAQKTIETFAQVNGLKDGLQLVVAVLPQAVDAQI